MRTIFAEVWIPAKLQAVWSTLTDLSSYPSWNPFIPKIEGEAREGAAWKMEVNTGKASHMKFDITLTKWAPSRQLSWRGEILTPKLFTSLHDFSLTEVADGVQLVQSETFYGLLIPVLFPMLKVSMQTQFARMNAALKLEVERRAPFHV